MSMQETFRRDFRNTDPALPDHPGALAPGELGPQLHNQASTMPIRSTVFQQDGEAGKALAPYGAVLSLSLTADS